MAKLLIVEDEYWTREMIKQYVFNADLGIEMVGEADNGADGCRFVQELVPDILLTDMKMPLMDGIDLLRYVEKNQPEMKVIVLSGYHDFKYTHRALRSGAVDYLLKPVDPEQLKQSLLLCMQRLEQNRSQPEGSATLSLHLKERKKVDLNEVYEYVQNHYMDAISLETAAHRFFISKEYLSKIYKLQYGENIMEQIIRLRMESAQSWILHHEIQVKHVAKMVGYEDSSYFHKVFKKHFGVSPTVMRDAFKGAKQVGRKSDGSEFL